MKKLFLLVSVLILSGCSPSPMAKAKQDFACKDKGGVYEYVVIGNRYAECMDGTYTTDWQSVVLTPEFYPKKDMQK